MSRLTFTFREFIEILERHGFTQEAQKATSHRKYVGFVHDKKQVVTVAFHLVSDTIKPKTLASMIRQSGLGKGVFRNKR